MIVGVHQPNYLPYLGFFDKLRKCDLFIVYDDAQFNKGDFQHRNRIRIYHGWKWLTVPVEKKHIPINQIKINNKLHFEGMNWRDLHLKGIHDNYRKAPFYLNFEKDIYHIYEQNYEMLIDINMQIIKFIMKSFNITTPLVFSSEFGFRSKSTEKLVDLVSAVEGDIYFSGPMGKNYLDFNLFEKKNIQVVYQSFKCPVYNQQYHGFEPNMSAIDAIFNIGRIPDEN